MNKKLFATLLAVMLVLTSLSGLTIVSAAGTGVEGDPYLISTADEFVAIKDNPSAYYKLTENIDLADVEWEPFDFSGHLDGDGKEISNFTLDSTAGTVGMFNYLKGATVENLVIRGSVKTTSSTVGALAGEAQGGSVIRNVKNYASVEGNTNIGGIAGIGNNTLIEDCENNGALVSTKDGDSYVGGIVGYNWEKTTITDCINNAVLTGVNSVGGIVGLDRQELTVTGCINNGDITATGNTNAGIVAGTFSETSTMDNCINNGDITGCSRNNAGIAAVSKGSITNTKNYGDVTQNSWTVGGITAAFQKGIIDNCENYGNITSGENHNGGIAGQVSSGLAITNCKNFGTITGGYQNTGGIVGDMSSGTITGCYNEGTIAGNRVNGGIIGAATSLTITDCINAGAITGNTKQLGGIAGGTGGSEDAITTITDCTNTGAVGQADVSTEYVGGIVALADYTLVENCTNNGIIASGSQRVGGILGTLNTGSNVINVVNKNAVSGTNYVGGIVGSTAGGTTVKKSINNGSVTGSGGQIGGIIGSSYSDLIQYCGNTGIITSSGNKGGICGQHYNTGLITDCYNASASDGAGGLVGAVETASANITNCHIYGGTGSNAVYNWKKGALATSNDIYYYGTFTNANDAVAMTAEEFADGTVVALLNGERTGSDAPWEQGELYPVFKTASSDEEPVVTAAEITDVTETTVTYNVTLAEEDASAVVIVAIYNDDILVDVQTVSASETVVEFESTAGATDAKIFVWENLTTIKPIIMNEFTL